MLEIQHVECVTDCTLMTLFIISKKSITIHTHIHTLHMQGSVIHLPNRFYIFILVYRISCLSRTPYYFLYYLSRVVIMFFWTYIIVIPWYSLKYLKVTCKCNRNHSVYIKVPWYTINVRVRFF